MLHFEYHKIRKRASTLHGSISTMAIVLNFRTIFFFLLIKAITPAVALRIVANKLDTLPNIHRGHPTPICTYYARVSTRQDSNWHRYERIKARTPPGMCFKLTYKKNISSRIINRVFSYVFNSDEYLPKMFPFHRIEQSRKKGINI